MTENQMYKELNEFANAHTLATHIKVTIGPGFVRMEPKDDNWYMKIEDTTLLGDIITGAQHYLYWKMRKKGVR